MLSGRQLTGAVAGAEESVAVRTISYAIGQRLYGLS